MAKPIHNPIRIVMAFVATMVLQGKVLSAEVGVGGQIACEAVTVAVAKGPGDNDARMVLGHAQSWVMGYVSANMDVTDDPRIFAGVNEDMISDWLVNDCKHTGLIFLVSFESVMVCRRLGGNLKNSL